MQEMEKKRRKTETRWKVLGSSQWKEIFRYQDLPCINVIEHIHTLRSAVFICKSDYDVVILQPRMTWESVPHIKTATWESSTFCCFVDPSLISTLYCVSTFLSAHSIFSLLYSPDPSSIQVLHSSSAPARTPPYSPGHLEMCTFT